MAAVATSMNLFSYIKQNVTLFDVVNEYATLKKAGLYHKALCPLHYEKTASFTVSPEKGIFYCFGCNAGGDVIAFIQKIEHCSPLEAAQFLAERFQLEIPKEVQGVDKSHTETQQKKQYYALCKIVADWFCKQLYLTSSVLDYLKKRGMSDQTIKDFNVGYFPGGQSGIKRLLTHTKRQGCLLDDLLSANILAQGSSSSLYSPYEHRIIFPIQDHLGRYCGFGGRTFKQEDDRAKYYNSKDHSFFSKGHVLFGFDKAKTHIQKESKAFLVEGYTDCLAMVQHGYKNTVATLGTACTKQHLKTLSRYMQHLYILYDGDKAGKKAVLRLTQLCWDVNLELNVVSLPTGKDPASFLEKYGSVDELVKQAKDIFLFFIDTATEEFSQLSLQEKVNTVRLLLEAIRTIDDPIKKEFILGKAAKSLNIQLALLKRELKNLKPIRRAPSQVSPATLQENTPNGPPEPINPLKEIPLLERKLFSVIINNMELLQSIDSDYLLEYLSASLQPLLATAQKLVHGKNKLDFAEFFETLSEQQKLLVSNLVLEGHEYEGGENFDYLLVKFQKKTWKSFVANTKLKLENFQQQGDGQTSRKLLAQFQELKKKLLRKGLI